MRHLINKFRRVTSTGSYLPEIDGLRFLAILWVFVYHLNGYLIKAYPGNTIKIFQAIAGNGHLGVELFFVISGFVLSLPFARYYLKQGKKIYLRHYFLRRFTRLGPPYFVVMTLLFIFLSLTHLYTARELTPHLSASLLYVHNIVYPGSLPVINPVAWSLEIEIQFYLLMPFLAYIFRLQKNTRRILLVLTMVIMPVLQYFYKIDTLFFYQFLQFFIAGLLLADIYITYDRQYFYDTAHKTKRNLATILGVFLFAGVLMARSTRTELAYTIFIPLAIVTFYCAVLFIPFWKKIFNIKWVSITGGMSYTIYLVHLPILATFGRFFIKYGISRNYFVYFIIQFLILGIVTMAVSSLFFYFIERPCMQKDWHIKLYKNRRSAKGK
ncbi:MAG: acyltransferase [Ginsengibacter sp.]